MLAVLCSAPLSIWSLQGSDTGLMCLWLTATVSYLFGVLGRPNSFWPLVVLFAAGPILRLDAMVYVVPMWLFVALHIRQRRLTVSTFVATTLVLAGILGFTMFVYGDPLPNTFYLKATGAPFQLAFDRGLESLGHSVSLWPLFVPAFAAVVVFCRDVRVLLCAALVAAIMMYNVCVGGDWADEYVSRFMVPGLPMLFVLCAGGIARGAHRVRRYLDKTSWLPAAAGSVALIACVAVFLSVNPAPAWDEWVSVSEPTMYRDDNERHANYALQLNAILSPSDVVAVHWAGVTPYFHDGPALDVFGKNDAHIAHMELPPSLLRARSFRPGHNKWDWNYVMDKRPAVVIGASSELKRHPVFKADYWIFVDKIKARKARVYVRDDVAERVDKTGFRTRRQN